LIESPDFPATDQHAAWSLSDTYKVFPSEVKAALLGRLRAGLAIPTQAEDLLRMENTEIDDGPVVAFSLDESQSETIVHGSLGVLGPQTVGKHR
jgi:hypothetical protein